MKTLLRFAIIGLLSASFLADAQTPNPDIAVSLNHVGVYVSNLAKSTAFYENILNLKQIPEPFHDGRHTWFTIGAAGHLHLIQGEAKEFIRDKNAAIRNRR